MSRSHTVVLDITERCNLKCVMCYFSKVDRLRFPPFDVSLSERGNMPVAVFEKIAADLFPRAWRVALGCAAEPMIHPRFRDIVAIAGRYRIPDLWFPTNLLALTEPTAEAIVDAGVTTVAASIDGITRETYEKIRVGGKWDRLISRLEMLNEVKRKRRRKRPRLRIIFTWMRSNRDQLRGLPAFAAAHGASELDVRFVSPTTVVDVGPELLSEEDPGELRSELAATAREAVARGLRLASFPEFETAADRPRTFSRRVTRRLWRLRSGLERLEYWRHLWRERRFGCAFPGKTWVVRPNGAVSPCTFWEEDPIGFYPAGDLPTISTAAPLTRICTGLVSGHPVGTCASCNQRRDAFYRPFRKLLGKPDSPPAMTALLENPEEYLQPLLVSEPPAAASPVHAYFEYYGLDLPDVDHRFGFFTSGTYRLAAHVFRPAEPRGTVVVLHGYYDHVGITKNLIHFLVEEQYAVAAYDMPGHGLSTGARASIDSFQEYVTALEDFLLLCRRHLPGPFHFVGHSLGGATALDHLLTAEETPFEKVVVLAPLVRSYAWELSKVSNAAAGRLVDSVPRVFRDNSSDDRFVKFIREDPLQYDHFPLKWADAAYAWNEQIKGYPPSERRVLVIQGTADTTVDWKYNVEFIQEKLPTAKIVLLKKARHHLSNESRDLRVRLLGEMTTFLSDSGP